MGKIETDHTGSGGGITLSSDGTSLLLDGTAIGGAALELYAENPSSPVAPSATGTNAVAIGSGAIASDVRAVALGLSRADGDDAVAIGIGATNLTYGARATGAIAVGSQASATALQACAVGTNATASGSRSNAFGHETDATNTESNAFGSQAQSTGVQSTAISRAYASGADSFAAAIANNTSSYGATGANSVAMGNLAKATSYYSISIGWNNSAGNRSLAIGGQGSTAGDNSVCVGTWQSNISNAYSAAVGGGKASDRGVQNRWAYGLVSAPAVGAAQGGLHVEYAQTTDATPTVLKTNSSPVNTQNQVILPNNSAYGFTGIIVAREAAASTDDFAVWEIKGGAVRGATAATTALGTYNINKISESAGAANWSIALSADTTNGAVAITVTGEAAHNIRWVATINTSEVTY